MLTRPFRLSESSIPLPRGTRVVLKVACIDDTGTTHRPATIAVVREMQQHTYTIETLSGRSLVVQRDQITPQRQDLLDTLGNRAWDFRRLRDDNVIYAAVVGSQAWNLANEHSDEDVRGCFVLPFDVQISLWEAPDEIANPSGEETYWEIEKLIHQGLRGDANTLETLWSPLVKYKNDLGELLQQEREIFTSMNVLGSFGRYAQSQFHKLEQSQIREQALQALFTGFAKQLHWPTLQEAAIYLQKEGYGSLNVCEELVRSCLRSLRDQDFLPTAQYSDLLQAVKRAENQDDTESKALLNRMQPKPFRPKNAYNLLRLLHSCRHWLDHGTPLIQVTGDLRATLLGIKEGRTPLTETIRMAHEVAATLDEVAQTSKLPASPRYQDADALLQRCRMQAAQRYFAYSHTASLSHLQNTQDIPTNSHPHSQPHPQTSRLTASSLLPRVLPVPVPPDINLADMRKFLQQYLTGEQAHDVHGYPRPLLWVSLTGAHAYGFPSPDSDLDLKSIYVAPAARLLGLRGDPDAFGFLGFVEGREYDFSANEIGQVVQLALKGNGNMLERLLGPFNVVTTPAGTILARLVAENLSSRSIHHYQGFFRKTQLDYAKEAAQGVRKAKRLLYGYRTALTGIHLLQNGTVETDIHHLARLYHYEEPVAALYTVKLRAEKQFIDDVSAKEHLDNFAKLEKQLDNAFRTSSLPAAPTHPDVLEDFLAEVRLACPSKPRALTSIF